MPSMLHPPPHCFFSPILCRAWQAMPLRPLRPSAAAIRPGSLAFKNHDGDGHAGVMGERNVDVRTPICEASSAARP